MITAPPRKLVSRVAKKTGLKMEYVRDVLVAAFEQIKDEAATGSIMIRGFGTFHTATRAGCVRPSPSDTSKIIEVPSTRRLTLRSPSDRIEEDE
jgi:nucleoid DNA-binding protein